MIQERDYVQQCTSKMKIKQPTMQMLTAIPKIRLSTPAAFTLVFW